VNKYDHREWSIIPAHIVARLGTMCGSGVDFSRCTKRDVLFAFEITRKTKTASTMQCVTDADEDVFFSAMARLRSLYEETHSKARHILEGAELDIRHNRPPGHTPTGG
jgi:hypothetical protein